MTLIVEARDLVGRLAPGEAIEAVSMAYRSLPDSPRLGAPHTRLFHEGRRATIHPGGSARDRAIGLFAHFERVHTGKEAQSYPAVGRRVYVVYDSETAELDGIILGSLPLFPFDPPDTFGTETAITSAVGTRLLARPDSGILALLGSGRQARRHLYALSGLFPLREVRVYSRSKAHVADFLREMAPHVACRLIGAESAEQAVDCADIVICATSSTVPVLDGAMLAKGAHVTSIVNGNRLPAGPGEPARFRRELDNATLARADVICAVMKAQAIQDEQGDLAEPVASGVIGWDDVVDLSEILNGTIPGRTGPGQITVFKQNSDQGVGFMALARLALDRARRDGLGLEL